MPEQLHQSIFPDELTEERQQKIVGRILGWDTTQNAGKSFEDTYRDAGYKYEAKYYIALSLLASPEYTNTHNPSFLASDFAHKDALNDPTVRTMHENLQFILIQGGFIEPDVKETRAAEHAVARIIESDEQLTLLRSILPVHVMGALTNALLFDQGTDEQRLERLRSFTTRSILGFYLGDVEVYRPIGTIALRDFVDIVPDRIFTNRETITAQVLRNHIVNEAMRLFVGSEEEGFRKLKQLINEEQSDVKALLLNDVLIDFQDSFRRPKSDVFRKSVAGWFTQESPFPLFRQRRFAQKFAKRRRDLLNGSTGSTKTACAYLAMETVGIESKQKDAQRVTIIGPAKAQNTWPTEADKIFNPKQRPDVFTIAQTSDIDDPRIKTAKYVYVGTELLAHIWGNGDFQSFLDKLVSQRKTDAIIIDESDEIRNPKTNTANAVKAIIDSAQQLHDEKQTDRVMPVLALTATPLASEISDLNTTMALLYPARFPYPGEESEGKLTFSKQVLRDPHIAYILLHGEELMTQWTLTDLFGENAPRLDYRQIPIPLSAYDRVLYEWVTDLKVGQLEKIRLLQKVLLNPNLILRDIRRNNMIPELVYSSPELTDTLYTVHAAWSNWVQELIDAGEENLMQPFSADWIAEYGETDLLIQCFFDPELTSGIDTLVGRFPDIQKDWQSKEAVSNKYAFLKRLLEDALPNRKVFIVSPVLKKGITRDALSDSGDDNEDEALSLVEHMVIDWFDDVPNANVINIDGQHTFTQRDVAAKDWRESGKSTVVVASMKSVYESMDWAIRDTDANKNINGADVVFLHWPWGWDEFVQMTGRFNRPGGAKPVSFSVLESPGTLDPGFRSLVRRKQLLMEMVLSGIELSPQDREFFERASKARRVVLAKRSVGQQFIRDTIRALESRGAALAQNELSRMQDGRSYAEIWAVNYLDNGNDRYRMVGNNARLSGEIADMYFSNKYGQNVRMADFGAGSCLFAREYIAAGYLEKLIQAGNSVHMDNIDMNGAVLALAHEHNPDIGNIIVADAAQFTTEPGTYDLVNAAFMLGWSKNTDEHGQTPDDLRESERGQILTNISQALKYGGIGIFTFPQRVFDDETFITFTRALEHFGFRIINTISGESYTVDTSPKRRIGWIITVEKTDAIDTLNLSAKDLRFLTDDRTMISKGRKRDDDADIKLQLVRERHGHPLFMAKQFQIQNPVSQQIMVVSNETVLQGHDVQNREDLKYQLNTDQLLGWNAIRKGIMRDLNIDYTEAEDVIYRHCQLHGIGAVHEWHDTDFQSDLQKAIIKSQN